ERIVTNLTVRSSMELPCRLVNTAADRRRYLSRRQRMDNEPMPRPAAKSPATADAPAVARGKPERSGRLSAEDWAQAALDLIAEQGVAAVAVEPLARRLGVTKGSFYWHFPSREALLQAALERWEHVEQEAVFGALERVPDPRERLRALFQMVAHEYQSH